MAAEGYFLAGHPALDFANTLAAPHGEPVDYIPDGAALLRWLVRAQLISPTEAGTCRRFPADGLDEIAGKARALRDELRRALPRLSADKLPRRLISALNHVLVKGKSHRRIESREGRIALVDAPRLDEPDQLLLPIAESIADLLAHVDAATIKPCENSKCILWFVDRTRGARRRFCSAAICGNRHKVAQFRARKRMAPTVSDPGTAG